VRNVSLDPMFMDSNLSTNMQMKGQFNHFAEPSDNGEPVIVSPDCTPATRQPQSMANLNHQGRERTIAPARGGRPRGEDHELQRGILGKVIPWPSASLSSSLGELELSYPTHPFVGFVQNGQNLACQAILIAK